jgi:ribonuclease E
MAKRMLIDATHPEETRVVVLNGNRLDEFDFESSTKKQVKGNIYLAKVTRVEPSLQAAFVEYGGNRHGFLAFSEIHPDYYRIPVADRRGFADDPRTLEITGLESGADTADEAGVPLEEALPEPVDVVETGPEAEQETGESEPFSDGAEENRAGDQVGSAEDADSSTELPWENAAFDAFAAERTIISTERGDFVEDEPAAPNLPEREHAAEIPGEEPLEMGEAPLETGEAPLETGEAPARATAEWAAAASGDEVIVASDEAFAEAEAFDRSGEIAVPARPQETVGGSNGEAEIIDTLGGDEFEDAERQRSRATRHYKIQEVIKRRQIMLVQVTKEERGNKGAALTTYLSLAGRYCVLMPNTARGGGVSRKITSLADRRRLKEILEDLDIPEGMGVIVRTAGAERSKAEIKRDYEYLLRLWNEIRDLTLRSTAPALIYEEGDLIKRSIRDLYTRDLEEVLVEGEEGYRTAKAFMKMLMPSHAKRVQPYRDPQIGLLHRFQVESQIDAIHSPIVQLRSGGYVVINQTEALVAIDVNSGRSTRERNIEETALRTNLEAAEEIARQLRLRDLAGLIVIDFIDMEEHRNQGAVERRLKEALKSDRARIQVGRISPFGLLEMSRQRLRPSLGEASTQPCPHCGGTGFIRSTESAALYVLRSIEEEGMRRRSAEVCVYVPTAVALYILNHKRDSLAQLETRYGIRALMARDDALIPPAFRLERLRALEPGEVAAMAPAPLTQTAAIPADEAEEDAEDDIVEAEVSEHPSQDGEDERVRARRRRRRRRRHEDERGRAPATTEDGEAEEPAAEPVAAAPPADGTDAGEEDEDGRLRRRRGRRGGRRRGRRDDGPGPGLETGHPAAEMVEIVASDAAPDGTASDQHTFEPGEWQPAAAESATAWPQAPVVEPATPLAPSDVETASLPVFAGDTAPSPEEVSAPAVAEGNAEAFGGATEEPPFARKTEETTLVPEPAPAALTGMGEWEPQTPPDELAGDYGTRQLVGNGASEPLMEALADEPREQPSESVEAARPEPRPETAAETPEAQAAPPEPHFVAEAEIVAESPPPPEAEAELGAEVPASPEAEPAVAANPPAEIVQEVTRAPENPRRGWWQRLIQP